MRPKQRWKQYLGASWWACRHTSCKNGHKPVRGGDRYANCAECGEGMHRTTEPVQQ